MTSGEPPTAAARPQSWPRHCAEHENLRDAPTDQQRLAILRIKDVRHRRSDYPGQVSGLDIYTAVIGHGVRNPERFGDRLDARKGTASSTA